MTPYLDERGGTTAIGRLEPRTGIRLKIKSATAGAAPSVASVQVGLLAAPATRCRDCFAPELHRRPEPQSLK
jgi:hypothetical protein